MPALVEQRLDAPCALPVLSEEAKRRGLPWQLAHNTLNSVFASLTVFGPVFVLFLDELGLPKTQIGLLLSLLPFSGLLALGFSPLATRWGRRRVVLVCWTARKLFIAGLLLLPWILAQHGHTAGRVYLVAVVAAFAVMRALAETAWYPWVQEVVPDRLRGRFGANSAVLGTVAACLALAVGGQVLDRGAGLDRFLLLIGIGCVFGLAAALVLIGVPGGEPRPAGGPHERHWDNMGAALRDRNFVLYLWGLAGVTLGTLLYLTFLPLFLKQRLGLPVSTVVTMETVVMVGGALSALVWGRAADRVGSRPVLMVSVALTLLVPLGWLLLPRQAPHLLLWCGALYLLHGMAFNGCAIGAGRLLLNGVVPPEQNTAYMAVFYSWQGLVGGAAPLLAGALLQLYRPWQGAVGVLTADGHAVLFLLATLAVALGWACYGRVRPDDRYRTRDLMQRLLVRVPWFALRDGLK